MLRAKRRICGMRFTMAFGAQRDRSGHKAEADNEPADGFGLLRGYRHRRKRDAHESRCHHTQTPRERSHTRTICLFTLRHLIWVKQVAATRSNTCCVRKRTSRTPSPSAATALRCSAASPLAVSTGPSSPFHRPTPEKRTLLDRHQCTRRQAAYIDNDRFARIGGSGSPDCQTPKGEQS